MPGVEKGAGRPQVFRVNLQRNLTESVEHGGHLMISGDGEVDERPLIGALWKVRIRIPRPSENKLRPGRWIEYLADAVPA
jgi:hypothetical protein